MSVARLLLRRATLLHVRLLTRPMVAFCEARQDDAPTWRCSFSSVNGTRVASGVCRIAPHRPASAVSKSIETFARPRARRSLAFFGTLRSPLKEMYAEPDGEHSSPWEQASFQLTHCCYAAARGVAFHCRRKRVVCFCAQTPPYFAQCHPSESAYSGVFSRPVPAIFSLLFGVACCALVTISCVRARLVDDHTPQRVLSSTG